MESKKILVAGSIVLDIIPEVYIPKGQPIPEIFLSEGKTTECSYTHIYLGSLVYKGRKVALYGGAYAPSYLPNDVDTFACGVNCGNH